MPQVEQRYPIIFKIVFWLLWLVGVGVFLVFAVLSSMTLSGGGYGALIGPWNLLVAVAEGLVLLVSAMMFGNGSKSASVLFLWVLLAAIVIPLIGFGGCVMQ